MDTCRVSVHQNTSLLWVGEGRWKAWEEGARRQLPGTGLGGLAGWGQKGVDLLGPAVWLRVGVLLTVVPYLTSAHAHSCGVMPKADAAPC